MNKKKEIESFNLEDLDIQELELRLETAGVAHLDGWGCVADCGGLCAANCGSNCIGNCTTLCGALGCWMNCSHNG